MFFKTSSCEICRKYQKCEYENIKNVPNNKASGGEIPLHFLKQSGFTDKIQQIV